MTTINQEKDKNLSHFTVLVTVDGSVKEADVESEVTKLLAPFDENTSVTPYIRNTKQQLIDAERKEILDYAETGLYAEYLKDPAAYIKTTNNRAHLRYLGVPDPELPALPSFDTPVTGVLDRMHRDDLQREEEEAAKVPETEEERIWKMTFPEKLALVDDDEFLFKLASRWFDPMPEDEDDEDYDSGQDKDGNEWSTYNPKSQWDWWVIGGRWKGMLNNTAGRKAEVWNGKDILRRRDLRVPESTFAYLTKDGTWVEKGSMGWFGMASNLKDQEDWDKTMAEYLLTVPGEDWLVVVDCHI